MERVMHVAGSLLVDGKTWRGWTVSLFVISAVVVCSAQESYKGENVCEHKKYSARPVHIRHSYKRPVHTLDLKKCREEGETFCNRTITSYRTTYRSVLRMRIQTVTVPGCCNGWRKRSPHDISCLQSECSRACENGGKCVGRETCTCPQGFTGTYCHVDIDECSAPSGKSPCQQKCTNFPGSFECACVEGFKLGDDARSCELCLSCSPEFQELHAQVNSLPDELGQIAEQYTRTDTQSDMKQAMERQAETFDKLQSQHDTIEAIQKQMDVLPEINARLDNLTGLQAQVDELKGLETRVDSVQKQAGDGLASIKASQTDLTQELGMAEQRWQKGSMASSQLQAEAIDRLQEQQGLMGGRIDRLEQENVKLREDLTSIVAMYESAMSALQRREEEAEATARPTTRPTTASTREPEPTTTPGLEDAYYLSHSSSEGLPYDRLASLSQQISILEEKISQCNCDQRQHYYG